MEVRCLEFVLLLWVPGLLQAQGPQPCSAPSLDAGFFLPVQESYPHGTKISYSCNDGYKAERGGWWGTSTCLDGIWFGTPTCIENPPTCCEPPKISNATIINLDFQDVFTQDTEVVYQCKDGHTTKEGATKKSVFCRAGVWTDVPTCVDNCGAFPQVPNGLAEPHEQRYLKYTCQDYYKLVGPDTVVCHRGDTWSEVPTCKEDFCILNTTEYPDLLDTGNPFIRNGDTEKRECVDKWTFTNYAVVQCIEGKLSVSRSGSCVLDLSRLNVGQTIQINIEDRETKTIECTQWKEHWMYARCSNGKIEATSCCSRETLRLNRCWFNVML